MADREHARSLKQAALSLDEATAERMVAGMANDAGSDYPFMNAG